MNDSRYTSPATDPGFGELGLDAAGTHLSPRYTAAFAQLFEELFDDTPGIPYLVPRCERRQGVGMGGSGRRPVHVDGQAVAVPHLPVPGTPEPVDEQMPSGRLFIGTGIYDSLTTIGSADHLLRQWTCRGARDLALVRRRSHDVQRERHES